MDRITSFFSYAVYSIELLRVLGCISIITLMFCLVCPGSAGVSEYEWYTTGISYYGSGDYDAAISAFLNAVTLNPEYAEAWNYLGLAYIADYQYSGAVFAFQKAVSLDPEYIEAWNNLGNTYELLDRNDDARLAYQRAEKLSADEYSPGYPRIPFEPVNVPMEMIPGNLENRPPGNPGYQLPVNPVNQLQGPFPPVMYPGSGPQP